MTGANFKIAVILIAGLLLGTLAAYYNRSEDAESEAEKPAVQSEAENPLVLSAQEINDAGIKIGTVQLQTLREIIGLTGTITPNLNRIAEVSPRVPGRIVSVEANQGARVKAGQTLAVLESVELGQAQADYLQARSEVTVVDAALVRAEGLVAEKIVPQKDYLRAKADAERAHAALQAATDKLKLLGVSPGQAPEQSSASYPLVAPFDGTVITKKAVLGQTTQSDQPLFTVADLTRVWLEADVFEQDLGKIVVGDKARVTVAAYPDAVFEGAVTYLGDTMDATTRTVKARIELPNSDGRLKPGMFATAQLQSTVTATTLAVPEGAVLLVQGQPAVFVEEDKGFEPRMVETGPAIDGWTPIRAGLAAGDRIVVTGAYSLKARLLKSQIGTDNE